VVAVDGKALQRALTKARGARALHLLHVWATRQQLLLGQKAVKGAPNEPVAIPEVLELLDLRGALVTTDANGCTTSVARAVRDGEADYALTLKGNRGPQHAFAKRQFLAAAKEGLEGLPSYGEEDKAHGRLEVRRAWSLPADGMPGEENWADVASITLLERERQQVGKRRRSVERTYILSSLKPEEVERIAKAARAHWGVENGLHWSLDVSFREDSHVIRDLNAAENLALVNRMALMMLKRAPSRRKISIVGKRKLAGWNRDYLLSVLSAGIAAV
jgi:predicted transposase YbfD/YdcC